MYFVYRIVHNWVGVLDKHECISLPISGTNRTNVRKFHSYLLQKIMHVIMYYNWKNLSSSVQKTLKYIFKNSPHKVFLLLSLITNFCFYFRLVFVQINLIVKWKQSKNNNNIIVIVDRHDKNLELLHNVHNTTIKPSKQEKWKRAKKSLEKQFVLVL